MGGKGPGNIVQRDIGHQSGWGDLPPHQRQEALQQIGKDFPAHYRDVIEQYFRKLATEESPGPVKRSLKPIQAPMAAPNHPSGRPAQSSRRPAACAVRSLRSLVDPPLGTFVASVLATILCGITLAGVAGAVALPAAGLHVIASTVDGQSVAGTLVDLSIDGVTTDEAAWRRDREVARGAVGFGRRHARDPVGRRSNGAQCGPGRRIDLGSRQFPSA